MITIRWTSATVGVISLAVIFFTPIGLATATLAGLFLAAFIVFCWTFRDTEWVRNIPEDHPDALGSLDLLDRAQEVTR